MFFRLILILSINCPRYILAQTDTTFIKSYYDNFVPRTIYSFKQFDFNIDKLQNDKNIASDFYSTKEQHFIGADASYKFFTLGYSYALNKQNSSDNFDLRFSTGYKPFNLQANFTTIKNINYVVLDSLQNSSYEFRAPDNLFRSFGVKLDYIFNYKKFCYSAAYTQGGQQLKSKGTIIASLAFASNNFNLGQVPDSISQLVSPENKQDFKRINQLGLDFGFGYSYNWVIKKKLLVSFVEIPCIGFQTLNLTDNTDSELESFNVPFVNHFKLGITFTQNRFFGGFSIANTTRVSSIPNFDFVQIYTAASVHVGWVFEVHHRLKKWLRRL